MVIYLAASVSIDSVTEAVALQMVEVEDGKGLRDWIISQVSAYSIDLLCQSDHLQ
jgi:hypothetical protein